AGRWQARWLRFGRRGGAGGGDAFEVAASDCDGNAHCAILPPAWRGTVRAAAAADWVCRFRLCFHKFDGARRGAASLEQGIP
ncbi:MAG: hypothetical protein WA924_08495, partial [Burkholderiaceae bacterium]